MCLKTREASGDCVRHSFRSLSLLVVLNNLELSGLIKRGERMGVFEKYGGVLISGRLNLGWKVPEVTVTKACIEPVTLRAIFIISKTVFHEQMEDEF